MPKYVYQNINTGEQYEFEQRFTDNAYTHHPETGEPIKRLIFAPAVVFKGSGWYAKDSKSGSSSAPKADSSSESKPKTESKSDSISPAPAAANTSAE